MTAQSILNKNVKMEQTATACGSSCGASDDTEDKKEESSACGSSCGTGE